MKETFEWDEDKNLENHEKHGVSFEEAQKVFADPHKLIIKDIFHSHEEERWFCVGDIGAGVITVRFTYRRNTIRIFGAGFWRKMRTRYRQQKESI